jgi:hypothetical protein
MSLCSNASIGSNADEKITAVAAEEPSAPCEDPNTANLLLLAVREVCSLPEPERNGSEQASVIEMLGGYPYIPPAEKELRQGRESSTSRNGVAKKQKAGKKGNGEDLNWTFSPNTPGGSENGAKPADDPPISPVDPIAATLEKRKELILTLGPVVERMEAKRKEETEAARVATGCRVIRTKKGRFKYYDVGTEEEVAPEEYKRRYFAMIGGHRGGDQDQNASANAPSPEAGNAPVAKDMVSRDAKSCQTEDPDQETSTHNTSIDDDGDDMDISLMSIAGETSRDMANGPDASFTGRPESDDREKERVASPAPRGPGTSSSPSSDFILPLPDRDDPDTDPQIAAAERRLWSDIDAALARYSREVISIRNMRFTSTQTTDSP